MMAHSSPEQAGCEHSPEHITRLAGRLTNLAGRLIMVCTRMIGLARHPAAKPVDHAAAFPTEPRAVPCRPRQKVNGVKNSPFRKPAVLESPMVTGK
jgi:hypothetical protein